MLYCISEIRFQNPYINLRTFYTNGFRQNNLVLERHRMSKIVRIFLFAAVICACMGAILTGYTRQIIINKAQTKADLIIQKATKDKNLSDDEKIIAITTEIFKDFHAKDPAEIPLYKIRPIITNHRLPSFIALPNGVMETLMQKGYCDNAARMLAFVLKQDGFESVQWNMVSSNSAHSALLVTLNDGRKGLVDPFYGYVAVGKDGKLLPPDQAQSQVKSGIKYQEVFHPLSPNSNHNFYLDFHSMDMAAQGDELVLEATIPPLNSEPLVLGKIDGNDMDVKKAAMKNKLSPFWHYMGHKYNRQWTRMLKANEPVNVTIILVEPSQKNILIATPQPAVKNKTLSWNLNSGESIVFKDGDAGISLKKMNSYIGVDQIIFTPI